MGSARHNRSEPADYLEGNRYRLHDSFGMAIGWPVKASTTGPGAASGGPVYDTVVIVAPYDDVTSKERCLGVSDDQILPRGAAGSVERTTYDALYKSMGEWRQGRREVAIVVHGVREMINKKSGWVGYNNDPVAPYPGGFVPLETGMTYLGRIKKGPIVYNVRGPIIIDPLHTHNNSEGWLDNGP